MNIIAGKKDGARTSQNREYMAAIGRKGGSRVAQNREHMAEIGRKGGGSKWPVSDATRPSGAMQGPTQDFKISPSGLSSLCV